MARPAALAVLLLALALAGCGDREAIKLQEARSWSATALLVAEHWARGEVPSAYARDALKKAADELAQGPFPSAAAPVADLESSVARDDRAAVRRQLDELAR
jgi:hypothetical protein